MYKHGVSATLTASADIAVSNLTQFAPVYIGTAPLNQKSLTDAAALLNIPTVITDYSDFVTKFGWSDNWKSFTLCEAVYAHFKNPIEAVGPIIVICVSDPATSTTQSKSTVLTASVGEIEDEFAILSSFAIADKVLGTDFKVSYNAEGTKVIVTALTTIASPVTITYAKMTAAVAGDISDAASALDFVYQYTQYIPSLIAAPTWTQTKTVRDSLVSKAELISNHYKTVVYTDIASSNSTVDAAISWKGTNGYSSIYEKTFYPQVSYNGRIYNLSTLAAVAKCQTDFDNGNIPYVSPSNKQIAIDKLINDNGDLLLSEVSGNLLNAEGITTAIYIGGSFRTWGPHNSNYSYGIESAIDLADRLDSSIAMKFYIANYFQANFAQYIDTPISNRDGNRVTTEAQQWLNSLVSMGALIGGQISFLPTVNPASQLANGDFKFNVAFGNAPNAKSIEFVITPDYNYLTDIIGGKA